jgi:XXXCH domain-containing protein
MKASERKIKREMPFEKIPTYLRQLADSLEKRTGDFPAEFIDLPEPITKLKIKGKSRNHTWAIKMHIKAEPPIDRQKKETMAHEGNQASTATTSNVTFKMLKKRMKSSFKEIGESIAARKLPEPDAIHAFLSDSQWMMAYGGEKYGKDRYPAYREACRRLAEAFEAENREALSSAYAELDQLKKDCHKHLK